MVNDAAGMAISAGALNMGPNVSLADADIQDICAHCCQHNWINTHDCHPCPGASNCDVADNDSAAFVSAERAAGFRLCQCSGLGTSDGPTQEDMRGLFMGFANGTSNTNCAGTQAVKIDTGCGTIENPANYRSGASACPAELSLGTDNAGGHPCNSGYPDGVENHAFFMSGDYSGAFFDCGPRNCDNPRLVTETEPLKQVRLSPCRKKRVLRFFVRPLPVVVGALTAAGMRLCRVSKVVHHCCWGYRSRISYRT